jgi:predicted P-loop ATPase
MNLYLHGVDINLSGVVRAVIQVCETVNGQDVLLHEDTVTLTSAKRRKAFIAYVCTQFKDRMNGTGPDEFERKLLALRQEAEAAFRQQQQAAAQQSNTTPAWMAQLSTTKDGVPHETLGNVTSALQHLAPWATECWYDAVRDLPMIGTHELSDTKVTEAGLTLERETGMLVRSRYLIPTALTFLCHQHPRDLLREWLEGLPPWDKTPRLNTWLATYAHAPLSVYEADVSRVLVVGMVARAMNPGCQFRHVVILEGPEDAGKTKLVRALATPEWYRELSHGLEGKEAHMRIKRAWVAELAELSSVSKTEENRLKSFFTLNEDSYIPKFSNFEVVHKRRAVFVGTVNPESDNAYLRGQTGNTRYLPVHVHDIKIEKFILDRDQIFAEALQYYRGHADDWWRLSDDGECAAKAEREDRRQRSVFEDELGYWLEQHTQKKTDPVTWWEELAADFLSLPRERWDRRAQMEVTKALKALGWEKGKQQRHHGKIIVPWKPGEGWKARPKP